MPCETPQRAYQRADGGPLSFAAPNPGNDPHTWKAIDVPCGHCILCRQEQARQWGVRITHEASLWEESSFVTLSYDDKHLPLHRSLDFQDLEHFWKRLRHHVGKLRYFAVGEYGEQTQRPHYHACIFGHAFVEHRQIIRDKPTLLWTSPLLAECWGKGHVAVGALNFQTAQYTASYTLKKLKTGQQYVRIDEETGELIRLVQPQPRMSRNIAREWWIRYGNQVADHDLVIINGRKQKPPKAYDRWLAEYEPERVETIKQKRRENAPAETPEKRHARAQNAHARAKNKSKTA